MRQEALDQKVYDAAPTENYESMDHETAQAGKYMATFPFPYMNGYLHLGKLTAQMLKTAKFNLS